MEQPVRACQNLGKMAGSKVNESVKPGKETRPCGDAAADGDNPGSYGEAPGGGVGGNTDADIDALVKVADNAYEESPGLTPPEDEDEDKDLAKFEEDQQKRMKEEAAGRVSTGPDVAACI